MKIDRREFESFRRENPRPQHTPFAGEFPVDLLRQAQVATAHLTGTPEWDVFLQRVQGWIDTETKLVASMTDNLPASMTSEQVLQAHRHILQARAKIEAWEQVLSLPKAILAAKAPEAKATAA